MIMDCANNGKNEVIVNTDVLETYLRDKYPNFKYIASTTRCERDVDTINKLCTNYDLVVPDYRDNKNLNFLSNLKYKNKIELLIDAFCAPNCYKRYEHYVEVSKCQLEFADRTSFICDWPPVDFYDILDYPTVITVDELYNNYIDMGFSNFKIEGRGAQLLDVIESYVYYLVKPEFKDLVRYKLIKKCWY
jgi:collagenase-like PrtC family protease